MRIAARAELYDVLKVRDVECNDAWTPANATATVKVRADDLRKEGYRFFFYSNDHEPIHVHVRHGGGEAVFDVREEIALRESQGLKVKELAKAQELTEENRELIIRKWHEHLA